MDIPRFTKKIRIGAASVIGPLHVRESLPNQDSFSYFQSDRLIALAVADGLGSAPNSAEGASYATHNAVHKLMTYLHGYGKPNPMIRDISTLKEWIIWPWQMTFRAAMQGYDTTLLFVGASPQVCVIGQIGDGLIMYRHADPASTYTAFQSTGKEFLNRPGATLAQKDAGHLMRVEEYRVTTRQDFCSFLLMTDGIADDLKDPMAYSETLTESLLRNSSEHWNALLDHHLTQWATVGHYDDKTIVVAMLGDFLAEQGDQNAEQTPLTSALDGAITAK